MGENDNVNLKDNVKDLKKDLETVTVSKINMIRDCNEQINLLRKGIVVYQKKRKWLPFSVELLGPISQNYGGLVGTRLSPHLDQFSLHHLLGIKHGGQVFFLTPIGPRVLSSSWDHAETKFKSSRVFLDLDILLNPGSQLRRSIKIRFLTRHENQGLTS